MVPDCDRLIRQARRRLFADQLLQTTGLGVAIGLLVGLLWFLAEPWLLTPPPTSPTSLRWIVLGVAVGLGLVAGVVWAIARRPSREIVALEVDRRFELRERVTTALGLRPEERNTPAGQAVLADAAAKIAGLVVAERFPIVPRRSLSSVPTLAILLVFTVFFYDPDTSSASNRTTAENTRRDPLAETKLPKEGDKNFPQQFTQQVVPDQLDRKKSEELKQLEAELNATMEKWRQNEPQNQHQAREKVTDLTGLEEKLKQFKDKEFQRLKQMEQQLQQLERLSDEKEFEDGPAKKLNDALAKTNLKKALDEVDELRKKAKDKKLDSKDLERLDSQLKEMTKQLRRDQANRDKIEKLKQKIEAARKDGQDAEALERELAQLESEMKQSAETMEKLAQKMEKLQQMAERGELEQLAEELKQMGDQLKGIEQEVEDLVDADEYLQRLRDELKKACKQCQGDGEGNELKETEDAKWTNKGQIGKGKRAEDRDGATASKDERIRGLFDKTGQKRYGGAVRGPAFTKKSTVELGQQIQQAAQEATRALDTQLVPREAQEGVKEYFEKIGGTGK